MAPTAAAATTPVSGGPDASSSASASTALNAEGAATGEQSEGGGDGEEPHADSSTSKQRATRTATTDPANEPANGPANRLTSDSETSEASKLDQRFGIRAESAASPAVARAEQLNQSLAAQRAAAARTSGQQQKQGESQGESTMQDDRAVPLPTVPVMTRLANGKMIASGMQSLTPAPSDDADPTGQLVGRGLTALIGQKGGTMTMRLDPPSLGELRITMTIQSGRVSAELLTSSPQAHAILTSEIASLRQALESHGLLVDRLSVQTNAPAQQHATPSRTDVQTGPQNAPAAPSPQQGGGADADAQDRQRGDRQDAGQGQSRGRAQDESRRERRDPSEPLPAERRRSFASEFASRPA
ncbi:MAG: flagellar hook-length control protein FliK [Phycisphaerae bacterium]|nr:flagellar hook-length control protein FliK [Phycisphaerae bacterium]